MNTIQSIDAVVLAGTHRNPKRLVLNRNKSFLPINGKPVIQYVIEALAATPLVKHIAVVGPQDSLQDELSGCTAPFIPVPDRGSFLQNAWVGYEALVTREANWPDLNAVRALLGGSLPPFKPFTPVDDKHQLVAAMALAMIRDDAMGMPLYRLERLVDDYFITKRRHGYRYSSQRQEEMIASLLEDQRIFTRRDTELLFNHELLRTYFAELGKQLDKKVLFLTGDIPLLIPEAVQDFILRCAPFTQDFYFGMSERRDLRPYYPTNKRRGIRRPYVQFHEYCARAANINLIRPKKIGNVLIIQQGFNIRKLKEWRNVMKLMTILYKVQGGLRSVWYVALFQAATVLSRHGWERMARQVRRFLPLYKVEALATRILQADFTCIRSPYGGISLDIDNQNDYDIIIEHFDVWMAHQHQIAKRLGTNLDGGVPAAATIRHDPED
ncbi:NTP transferase domain-containing protein [bacterium]|nr:NTP transferase domain-containing protein [candidate division CSSED10-310 bacterium]